MFTPDGSSYHIIIVHVYFSLYISFNSHLSPCVTNCVSSLCLSAKWYCSCNSILQHCFFSTWHSYHMCVLIFQVLCEGTVFDDVFVLCNIEKKFGVWLVDVLLLMLQGWKRHGHSCYAVTSHEQSYEDALMGYYCKAPLLTVENRWFIAANDLFCRLPNSFSCSFWEHWSLCPHFSSLFLSCWQVWAGFHQQFAEWEWGQQQHALLDRPHGPGERGRVQLASS